jgi:hypothetical protein
MCRTYMTLYTLGPFKYAFRPECEHVVEPLVLELQIQVWSDVGQRLEHLQAHTLKQSMEFWQKKEQLLSKSACSNMKGIDT